MRLLRFVSLLTAAVVGAWAADKNSIIGKVQPEIRLVDGTIFTKAKIVSYSLDGEKPTVTIAEPTRLRTVPLEQLPPSLRSQVLADAGIKPDPVKKVRRTLPASPPPAPPPDKTILPDPPVATATTPGAPATALDSLLKQAAAAAPDELKFHLTKAYERVGSLTCKIRDVAQVPGWQKIRVSGDAAFTQWDARQSDHVWRTEKFEVEFALVEGRTLRAETVTFAGLARPVAAR